MKKAPPLKPEEAEQASWLTKAFILADALPYMRAHSGSRFVVKYGGHAMGDPEIAALFAHDLVLFKLVGIHPCIVHGGGPQIGEMLDKLEIRSEYIDGLRVTDAETVEVVEMVLSGKINKAIVAGINRAGGRALGLSGKDGNLIQAGKLSRHTPDPDSNIEKVVDLGFVGTPEHVDPKILEPLLSGEIIPVIAPVGIGKDGETYNINADTAAGAVAASLHASRLLMLTDVPGVLDENGDLIPRLSPEEARSRIADGTISDGMIPKVETCIEAVENGTEAAVILDGRVPHALLVEIFTPHGAGTMICQEA